MIRLALVQSAAAIAGLVAQSPAARADAYRIHAPAGWHKDDQLAQQVNQFSQEAPEFPGLAKKVATVAWVRPGVGALYIQSIFAEEPSADPSAAAQAEIDRLKPRAEASAGALSSLEFVSWRQDTEQGVARVTFHWRDTAAETETITKELVFAAEGPKLRIVRGECVLSLTAADTDKQPCRRALESLELEGDALQRLPLEGLRDSSGTSPPGGGAGLAGDGVTGTDGEASDFGGGSGQGAAAGRDADGGDELGDELAGLAGNGAPKPAPGGLLYAGPPKKLASKGYYWFFFAGALVLMLGFFLLAKGVDKADKSGERRS